MLIKLNNKAQKFKLPKNVNQQFKTKHEILWELTEPIIKPSYIDIKIIVNSENPLNNVTIKNANILVEGINFCDNPVSFKNKNENVFETSKNNNKPYWEYSLIFDKSFRKEKNDKI